MNLKSIIAVLCLSVFCFSAKAATFNISSSSSHFTSGFNFSVLNGSIDLLDGETGMTNAGMLSASQPGVAPPFDADFDLSDTFTVQSGGETLMTTGPIRLHIDNNTGPFASYSLLSDLSFDFSFGQFTLLAGTLGTVHCSPCAIGETAFGDLKFTARYNAISAVPLPAGLPMMAGGLALIGYLGWRRKKANT